MARHIPDLYDFLKDEGRIPESEAVRGAGGREGSDTHHHGRGSRPARPRSPVPGDPQPVHVHPGLGRGQPRPRRARSRRLLHRRRDPAAHAARRGGQGQIFLSTFQEKGRLSPLLARVRVHIIVEPVALLGAAFTASTSRSQRGGERMIAQPVAEATQLDQLCINTIRTLSMDAVQQANSGHLHADGDGADRLLPVATFPALRPGAPDLAEPRSVRALGQARIDAALQHAAPHGVKAVNPKYETLGELSVTLDDIKQFRQIDGKCGPSRVPLDVRVETTTGPLGQGVASSVGMALGARWLGALQPGLPAVRLRRVCAGRRRLLDGGDQPRGSLARRAPGPLQPLLDLRQQPHHHRRQHRAGLQRRRRHAVHRLRLERDAGGRCQRPGDALACLRDVPPTDRPT